MKSTLLRLLVLTGAISGISLLHYFTPLHLHYLHDIFQRFYYLPIILAAVWFGFRGGLFCGLAVSVVYAPHILFQWGGGLTLEMEKYLEILLYNIVGSLTGLLSQRERERSRELELTAQDLAVSYQRLQDQSERMMRIEDELRQAEKLSSMGEMAAVLAHEIRNPLGSIRGTAEILRDDYPPGTPKHEFIEIQIKETERLNRVVEDFLRMARQKPLDQQTFSLVQELDTIKTLVAHDAQKRGIALCLEPFSRQFMMKGDGEKLRQALLNIVLNALQATPAGGRVTLSLQSKDAATAITVTDTGQGIPADAIERIFTPFYTTKQDGTGLGLAVAKKIIEGHGGTLTVTSEAGTGTTVTIMLPTGAQQDTPL